MREFTRIFWVPLLLAAAFLIFGLGLPRLGVELPPSLVVVFVVVAVVLIVLAGFLSHRTARVQARSGTGGPGGKARVLGTRSEAYGGPGGHGDLGAGGKGGDAEVVGDDSVAAGGAGGDGAKRHS